MTLANDPDHASGKLSPTSIRMLELREQVLDEWARRVRASLPQARQLRHPVLIDTIPAFYDNIAEAVSAGSTRKTSSDGSTTPTEHGGERARLTGYDHEALIGEYQILRGTIFDLLHDAGLVLAHQDILTIDACIDIGIKEAVNAFALVHSGMRERFAAALTHDMRGPLSVGTTALELILRTDDPARIKAMAAKALASLRRIDVMVSELLDSMAFHGAHEMRIQCSNFNVIEIVREIEADTAPLHQGRLQVSGQDVSGWWGRSELKRAIENVVSNAFKYGDADRPVTLHIEADHQRLIIKVHNEGEPIPIEEQECIFQMYRRAEAATRKDMQGWGIGLPYVRAVAECHGGSVGLDSAFERGTTFLIDLPIDCRGLERSPTLGADALPPAGP